MKELVEMIAKALVDNPEQVVVTEVEGEQTTVLELRVAPTDLGKVIGKQGRTARCIRTLLGAAGMKLRKTVRPGNPGIVEPITRPPFVSIARIVRTRGIRGELVAESYTDFPERFSLVDAVWLEFADGSRERYAVERIWEHKGRPVLKLTGVDSISAAQRLVGAWVQVEEAEAVTLPAGTYFDHDLVGCVVVGRGGRILGRVADVLRLSGNRQLVIRGESGEFMVPVAADVFREISIPDKRIVVDLPEGLVDLNE